MSPTGGVKVSDRPTKKHRPRPTKKVQPKRNKVRVKFTRAGKSPSERKKVNGAIQPHERIEEVFNPYFQSGRNPLNRYIVENEGAGLEMAELVEQFQEYDCRHNSEPDLFAHIATQFRPGLEVRQYRCPICFFTKEQEKEI